MSLDQDLKNAFERHARDAQPDSEAWQTVERRIRRAHKQRIALVSTLTVALIAAAAVLVPRIGTKDESRGFTNPSVTPTATSAPTPTVTPTPIESPSAGPAIPAGWQRRVGVQSAFQLAIPATWKGGWFEGTWDFEPKGQPSVAEGGDLFAVTVTVQDGTYETAPSGQHATRTTVNGMRALTWTTGTDHLWYAIEWLGCPGYAPECSSNFSTRTLIVHLFASTRALWDRYLSTGKEIVSTVWEYDGSSPVHGTISDSIARRDDFTSALIRFLDARVEGIGADELMTSQAAEYYNAHGGLYELNGEVATHFVCAEALQPQSSSFEAFRAIVTYRDGHTRTEWITLTRANQGSVPSVSSVDAA